MNFNQIIIVVYFRQRTGLKIQGLKKCNPQLKQSVDGYTFNTVTVRRLTGFDLIFKFAFANFAFFYICIQAYTHTYIHIYIQD